MRKGKPSITDIEEEFGKNKKLYGPLRSLWEEDERFYELDFKKELNIPKQFAADRVITSTGRDVVDAAINHTDIMNARVFVNKKGTGETSKDAAEMARKLALGLIHRSNVESSIAPGRVGAKHFWVYGLAVYKTVWDADRWLDKPEQKDDESEETYAKRIDEWRAETHLSLPIVIQPVNPYNILPDPYTGGDLYVMEQRERSLFDVQLMYPHWTNPKGRKLKDKNDRPEIVSYWDKDYRCELIDGQPVLKIKGGVVNHNYGFIPYTLIESGLGNLDKDANPEQRYVGLLRYIYDLLVSESTNYTLCDILMKRETMLGGYITGADAETLPKIEMEYGKWWPVGDKDVKFNKWPSELAPDTAYQHLALTRDYIAGHAAPRSVRGQPEPGVRSGADRRLILAEAAAIYQYASPAFAHGWANILNKCARLVKNVIPGDFEIWARTPTDEFDVVVKKSQLREPFNYYVQFAPISEEDEYRQHDDLIRRGQAGLIDEEYAWERQNDVDPEAMRKRMKKKQLRSSPAYLTAQDQMMAMMFMQAAQQAGVQLPLPMEGMGATEVGGITGSPMPRRNVPPIREASPMGTLTGERGFGRRQGQGGGGMRG